MFNSSYVIQVKLDVYLAELTKIGKSQKYTLSVDVEGGRLVVMKKVKDSQEDWTTFTHDKSEKHTNTVYTIMKGFSILVLNFERIITVLNNTFRINY